LPHEAAASLRWSSERVPMATYKRQQVVESRVAGSAISKGLKEAEERRQGKAGKEKERAKNWEKKDGESSSSTQGEGDGSMFSSFPMIVRVVGDREVCRPFQFGACQHENECGKAHVCHECGSAHPQGGLCESARKRVSEWLRARFGGVDKMVKARPQPSRASARLAKR
jgi:hypothetical protein